MSLIDTVTSSDNALYMSLIGYCLFRDTALVIRILFTDLLKPASLTKVLIGRLKPNRYI